jgi:uncharacterized membrane protein
MSTSERSMVGALCFAALDSGYLAWRYLALRLALVTPGTSICSWTIHIDCDRVLLTPQANAFFVPNALLGFAFYIGCLIWWVVGKRLGPDYRFHLLRTLVFWLAVASVFTLRFFWLLFHLSYFCPLCPLNHLMTYVALFFAVVLFRQTPRAPSHVRLRPLLQLVLLCVLFFVIVQLLWFVAQTRDVLHLPAPAPLAVAELGVPKSTGGGRFDSGMRSQYSLVRYEWDWELPVGNWP